MVPVASRFKGSFSLWLAWFYEFLANKYLILRKLDTVGQIGVFWKYQNIFDPYTWVEWNPYYSLNGVYVLQI